MSETARTGRECGASARRRLLNHRRLRDYPTLSPFDFPYALLMVARCAGGELYVWSRPVHELAIPIIRPAAPVVMLNVDSPQTRRGRVGYNERETRIRYALPVFSSN